MSKETREAYERAAQVALAFDGYVNRKRRHLLAERIRALAAAEVETAPETPAPIRASDFPIVQEAGRATDARLAHHRSLLAQGKVESATPSGDSQ